MCRIGHLILRCMVRSVRMRFGKLVWLLTEGGHGMWMGLMVRGMIGRLLMLGMGKGIWLSRIGWTVGWIEVGVRDVSGLRMEGHVSACSKRPQGYLSGAIWFR